MPWYAEAGIDYISFCPVFIGSSLDERILWAEIERAKRDNESTTGQGFAITPDHLTPLKRASLRARGIIHVRSTLGEFVQWLEKMFPGGYNAGQVVAFTNRDTGRIEGITTEDINAVSNLMLIDSRRVHQDLGRLNANEIDRRGRSFYRGFPPTWIVAASNIPVWLNGCEHLLGRLEASLLGDTRLLSSQVRPEAVRQPP